MKKLVMASMLALGALAVSSQPASAWTKFKFGIGANISYTGSGNCLFWGAAKGAPLPDCGMPGGGFPGGYAPTYGDYGAAAYTGAQGTPTAAAAQPVQPVFYGQGYQPASYYYPTAGYTYYPAPSYWYGR
jgi:hypothetical protein